MVLPNARQSSQVNPLVTISCVGVLALERRGPDLTTVPNRHSSSSTLATYRIITQACKKFHLRVIKSQLRGVERSGRYLNYTAGLVIGTVTALSHTRDSKEIRQLRILDSCYEEQEKS